MPKRPLEYEFTSNKRSKNITETTPTQFIPFDEAQNAFPIVNNLVDVSESEHTLNFDELNIESLMNNCQNVLDIIDNNEEPFVPQLKLNITEFENTQNIRPNLNHQINRIPFFGGTDLAFDLSRQNNIGSSINTAFPITNNDSTFGIFDNWYDLSHDLYPQNVNNFQQQTRPIQPRVQPFENVQQQILNRDIPLVQPVFQHHDVLQCKESRPIERKKTDVQQVSKVLPKIDVGNPHENTSQNSSNNKILKNPAISDSISRNWTPQKYTHVVLLMEIGSPLENLKVKVHPTIAGGRSKNYQSNNAAFLLTGGIKCRGTKINENYLFVRKKNELCIEPVQRNDEQIPANQHKLEFEVQLKCTSSQIWQRWKDFRITVEFKLEHIETKEHLEWSFDVISQGNRSILQNRRKKKRDEETTIYPNELINNMKNSIYREYKPMAQIGLGVLQLTLHMTKPDYLQELKKKKKTKKQKENYSTKTIQQIEQEMKQQLELKPVKGVFRPVMSEWKQLFQIGKENFNTHGQLAIKCLETCFFRLHPEIQNKTILESMEQLSTIQLGKLDLELLIDIASLHARLRENQHVKTLLAFSMNKANEGGHLPLASRACYQIAENEYFRIKRLLNSGEKVSLEELFQDFIKSFEEVDRQTEILEQKLHSCLNDEDRKILMAYIADCYNLKGVLYGMMHSRSPQPLYMHEELKLKYNAYMMRAVLNPWSIEFAQSCNNMGSSLQKLVPNLENVINFMETLELLHVIKMFKERAFYIQGLYPEEKHIAYYLYKKNLFKTHEDIAFLIHKLKNTKQTEKNWKKAMQLHETAKREYKEYENEFFPKHQNLKNY